MKSDQAEGWNEALQKELKAMESNEVYDWATLPRGRRAVTSKLLFTTKTHADGSLDKLKVRLVARGYSQVEGLDYEETFAPVLKYPSMRVFVANAASKGLKVHQMDVTTAFLNGVLLEDIYMRPPPGLKVPGKEGMVWKLKKSLYGLKQSPRVWNAHIDGTLTKVMGFTRCKSDTCLYIKGEGENKVYLGVYVDDLLIATGNMDALAYTKKVLTETYHMTDVGLAKKFLGIEVEHQPDGSIKLHQNAYVRKILETYEMANCKAASTPFVPRTRLVPREKGEGEPLEKPFRELVGSLMYLTTSTRPDLAFAVSQLSRVASNPSMEHWQHGMHVLRYLTGTGTLGLTYPGPGTQRGIVKLSAYTDTDWAGDSTTSRSTQGYIFMINGAAVSWNSSLQPKVAMSSTEAEYYGAANAATEAEWMRMLLEELGHPQQGPTPIFADNQSCIALSKNPVFHKRTKHIPLRYHKVRELVEEGTVELQFTRTDVQAADMLTKATEPKQLKRCCSLIKLALD